MGVVERWLPIAGHQGYEVSDHGRVRSIDRVMVVPTPWGGFTDRKLRGRVLRTWNASKGRYAMVSLGIDRANREYVHRLVATTFCPQRFDQGEVNHVNGQTLDNRAVNLEWVTARENMLHSTHVLGNRAGQFGKGRIRVAA